MHSPPPLPQSWLLNIYQRSRSWLSKQDFGERSAAERFQLGPCQARFPLPDSSVPRHEPCFLHLGLGPEVQFGADSEASSEALATHIPAFCAHTRFPLPEHQM